MQLTTLEQTILSTVTYFNLFKLPLTCWEIHKNLYKPNKKTELSDIEGYLDNLVSRKILEFNEGFYFLPNNQNLVMIRKQRYLIAQRKMKVALKNIKLIRKLPFIKAIFVCNNLAYLNAHIESDIDLAIITKSSKIWTARFFSAGLMKIINRRPTPSTQKDRICLSFFISEDNLDLQNIAYQDDIHFVYWVSQFMPVYDKNTYSKQFLNNNKWTKAFLPNIIPLETNKRWQIESDSKIKALFETLLSLMPGNLLEKSLKSFQMKIMPAKLANTAKKANTNVIVSDKVLKFHDKDKRIEIKRSWESAIQSLK